MYLIHNTTSTNILPILKSGQLLSSYITGNASEGSTMYEKGTSKYVYFSTCDRLFDNRTYASCIMYINSSVLYNRKYYLSSCHTVDPKLSSKTIYKKNKRNVTKSYPRYDKYFNKRLRALYRNSVSALEDGKAFAIFQQVAINNKIKIKDSIIGIEFRFQPSEKITNYLKKHYPNVKIYINANHVNLKIL